MWFSVFKIKKHLSRCMDDDFKFVDKELFEHLKKCERCALEEFKKLKKMHAILESARGYTAPYGFSERVMRRISDSTAPKEATRINIGIFTGLAEAFALILISALGIISGNFLAANILNEGSMNGAENVHAQNISAAYSPDAFDSSPPDSIEKNYLAVTEDVNER